MRQTCSSILSFRRVRERSLRSRAVHLEGALQPFANRVCEYSSIMNTICLWSMISWYFEASFEAAILFKTSDLNG